MSDNDDDVTLAESHMALPALGGSDLMTVNFLSSHLENSRTRTGSDKGTWEIHLVLPWLPYLLPAVFRS